MKDRIDGKDSDLKIIEGDLIGTHKRFAIVVSKVHPEVTHALLEGAVDFLLQQGVEKDSILVIKVPGAWEIPIAVDRFAKSNAIDAVICLGAVVREETPHYYYLAGEVSKAIAHSSRESGKPVSFGVMMSDTEQEAQAMVGTGDQNKGWEAARSAMEMADLLEQIGEVEGSSYLQRLH
jgi:6,7-dimethyl-8-ribityllumazine synthase